MEDNISHLIAMIGATLLFMVAFSCSMIFYNGLETRAEEFFEVTSLSGRREDATMIQADSTDIERKITFQEVYMAILNLPVYVSDSGNSSDSKIVVKGNGGNSATYVASFDITNNIRKIDVSGTTYDRSYIVGEDDNSMIRDFSALVLSGASTTGTSNAVLRGNIEKIKETTFSISYSGNEIVYTKN